MVDASTQWSATYWMQKGVALPVPACMVDVSHCLMKCVELQTNAKKRDAALEEVRAAVEELVLAGGHAAELAPRSPDVMQAQACRRPPAHTTQPPQTLECVSFLWRPCAARSALAEANFGLSFVGTANCTSPWEVDFTIGYSVRRRSW